MVTGVDKLKEEKETIKNGIDDELNRIAMESNFLSAAECGMIWEERETITNRIDDGVSSNDI